MADIDGPTAAILLKLAELRSNVEGIDSRFEGLEARVGAIENPSSPEGGYHCPPQPQWWAMDDEGDRARALARLRSWVEGVYKPGMGKQAERLPECWDRHAPCIYVLDWLSEYWSLLYLQTTRPAAVVPMQADWWTRHLPAAAELMAVEAKGCDHARIGVTR